MSSSSTVTEWSPLQSPTQLATGVGCVGVEVAGGEAVAAKVGVTVSVTVGIAGMVTVAVGAGVMVLVAVAADGVPVKTAVEVCVGLGSVTVAEVVGV